MKQTVLVIDTTSTGCHVGLSIDNQFYQLSDTSPQSHAKQVLNLVDKLMSDHGVSRQDLTGIVYTQGPGAFTGIRIGVSVVQGISMGLNLPTIGISSLLFLAWQAAHKKLHENPTVISLIDARMNQVYWASYQFHESTKWQVINQDSVGLPTSLPDYDAIIGDGIAILQANHKIIALEKEILATTDLSELWLFVQYALKQHWLSWTQELPLPVYLRQDVASLPKNQR